MTMLAIGGVVSFAIGVLMIAFHMPIGKAFSKTCMSVFKSRCFENTDESIYEEAQSTYNIKILGLAAAMQGFMLLLVIVFCKTACYFVPLHSAL